VKYKALCCLAAYSWQCHELLNRFVDEFVLHGAKIKNNG
jgi:hypothetical protein